MLKCVSTIPEDHINLLRGCYLPQASGDLNSSISSITSKYESDNGEIDISDKQNPIDSITQKPLVSTKLDFSKGKIDNVKRSIAEKIEI